MSLLNYQKKVLSGMRPTGKLHLGHYHGVLKNWLKLQQKYQCYFFIADWHALTTHYQDQIDLQNNSIEMMIDFLSVGMDPDKATFFIQSQVKQHAELSLLLSMITPLSWLERVPSYKDLQEKLKDKNLLNTGFLCYPLLQTADILIYQADLVPVGEDQVAHIELAREIARKFNFIYGKNDNFSSKIEAIFNQWDQDKQTNFNHLRKKYLQKGDKNALVQAQKMIKKQVSNLNDYQIMQAYLTDQGQMILNEPKAKLTKVSKLPGLDGEKMSKSYNNTIFLRESPTEVAQKIKKMKTDPARVRRTDIGNPKKCPVYDFHQVYSDKQVQNWAKNGCKTASIGCIDCKKPLIDAINGELSIFHNNRLNYNDKAQIIDILNQGADKARQKASQTLSQVYQVMKLFNQ